MADCTNNDITKANFIAQFPEFTDAENIDTFLQRAMCFITPFEGLCCCRQLAIFLMSAHLLTIQKSIASGETSMGFQGSASIDRVSVSVIPPPFTDAFDYWLNLSPYGQQLLALMEAKIPSPQYFGGSYIRVLE